MREDYPIQISAIFSHPEARFGAPFQVPKEMMRLLSSSVADCETFDQTFGPESYLCLMYSSDPDTDGLIVKGAIISKRYRVVEYALKMPFKEITPMRLVWRGFCTTCKTARLLFLRGTRSA